MGYEEIIGSGAAILAILSTLVSFVALLTLHLLSREFSPSWRMVSDYANGGHSWLLTIMFVTWALSSFALAAAFIPIGTTFLGVVGILFLILAGVGELMGGLFDVNHKLHGVAFTLGVPSLALAAILLTIAGRQAGLDFPIWVAALPTLSILLMAISMFSFMSSLESSGVDFRDQLGNLTSLPEGITVWNGWANRIVFLFYYFWVISAAFTILNSQWS